VQSKIGITIPSIVGFTVSVSFTLAVALLSYRYWVRYGMIGRWLHGPKTKASAFGKAGT